MINFGMVRPGTTLYIPFETFAAAGESITMTGLAVTDIEIYKNGSATQRASDAGYALLDTDGIDFDLLTGIHGFSVNLADNTTADFFTAGAQYWVVVSAVTVDAKVVSFVAAMFSIGYAEAILNTTLATLATQTSFTLTDGPAEDDALNGCVAILHDIASAVQWGKAVIQDYTGATKTVTLVAGATFTVAAGDNISVLPPALQPTTWGGTEVVQTGDSFARLGAPAGASVSADIVAVKVDTTAILVDTADMQPKLGAPAGASISADIAAIEAQTDDIGAAGAGLTALGDTRIANLDATVSSRATPAQVNTEVDTALADVNLDHLVGTAVAIPAIVAGTYIDQMMDDGTAVYDRLTDSLQAIRDTAPLGTAMRGTDSAALASVCTETRLAELDAANLPTDITTIDDFLDTEIAAIKAKTDSLTFTIANTLDANVQSINDVTIVGNGAATPFGV